MAGATIESVRGSESAAVVAADRAGIDELWDTILSTRREDTANIDVLNAMAGFRSASRGWLDSDSSDLSDDASRFIALLSYICNSVAPNPLGYSENRNPIIAKLFEEVDGWDGGEGAAAGGPVMRLNQAAILALKDAGFGDCFEGEEDEDNFIAFDLSDIDGEQRRIFTNLQTAVSAWCAVESEDRDRSVLPVNLDVVRAELAVAATYHQEGQFALDADVDAAVRAALTNGVAGEAEDGDEAGSIVPASVSAIVRAADGDARTVRQRINGALFAASEDDERRSQCEALAHLGALPLAEGSAEDVETRRQRSMCGIELARSLRSRVEGEYDPETGGMIVRLGKDAWRQNLEQQAHTYSLAVNLDAENGSFHFESLAMLTITLLNLYCNDHPERCLPLIGVLASLLTYADASRYGDLRTQIADAIVDVCFRIGRVESVEGAYEPDPVFQLGMQTLRYSEKELAEIIACLSGEEPGMLSGGLISRDCQFLGNDYRLTDTALAYLRQQNEASAVVSDGGAGAGAAAADPCVALRHEIDNIAFRVEGCIGDCEARLAELVDSDVAGALDMRESFMAGKEQKMQELNAEKELVFAASDVRAYQELCYKFNAFVVELHAYLVNVNQKVKEQEISSNRITRLYGKIKERDLQMRNCLNGSLIPGNIQRRLDDRRIAIDEQINIFEHLLRNLDKMDDTAKDSLMQQMQNINSQSKSLEAEISRTNDRYGYLFNRLCRDRGNLARKDAWKNYVQKNLGTEKFEKLTGFARANNAAAFWTLACEHQDGGPSFFGLRTTSTQRLLAADEIRSAADVAERFTSRP